MKRYFGITVVLLVVLSLGLVACGAAGQAPGAGTGSATDLGGREIIVAVEDAYPPFNSLDEDGNGIGYDYDFFREVCERANCEPVFKVFAWEGMFEAAQAGEYDVTCDGITLNLERAKIIDYSDPIIEYGMVLVVRADETELVDLATLGSLTDKIVGVQLATTNEAAVLPIVGEERIMAFDEFPIAVEALIAGDVDTVPIDGMVAIDYLKANPGKLKILEEQLTSGEFIAVVAPPGSDVLPAVDQAINEMWEDGTMDELYDKWFSPPE
jgi:polar amino acid transport system substrate-binding protein